MLPLLQNGFDYPVDPTGVGLAALAGGFLVFAVVLFLVLYIYMSLAMMKTAQKLKTENAWLAWIPIGNIYLMSQMAEMHWWPVLLIFSGLIPFIGWIGTIALLVFYIVWQYKICERRNKPGWWAILTIIPIIGPLWNLIMWGILAWGK